MGDDVGSQNPLAEVTAMQKIAEAVAGLESDAVVRVLRWASAFYKVGSLGESVTREQGARTGAAGPVQDHGDEGGPGRFADLASLYAATSPASEADRVLVASYWAQFGEGKAEFTAQEVNSALKHLGFPIKNITTAFDTLKQRKPAPVMQLKKSGTTRQARKTYRVTVAGKSVVEALISQQ